MNSPARTSRGDSARAIAGQIVNEIRAFRFVSADPAVVEAMLRAFYDAVHEFPASFAFMLPALRETLDEHPSSIPSPRVVVRLARCRTHAIPSERESVFVLRSLIATLALEGARSLDEADTNGRLRAEQVAPEVVETTLETLRGAMKLDAVVRRDFAASGDTNFDRWFEVYFDEWRKRNADSALPTRLKVFESILSRGAAPVLARSAREFGCANLTTAVIRSDSVVLREWRAFYGDRVDAELEALAAMESAP